MKPSNRIQEIERELEQAHISNCESHSFTCVTLPGAYFRNAVVQYLDEEWNETHCEIPQSAEPGTLHDCSKIHVTPSPNAQQPK